MKSLPTTGVICRTALAGVLLFLAGCAVGDRSAAAPPNPTVGAARHRDPQSAGAKKAKTQAGKNQTAKNSPSAYNKNTTPAAGDPKDAAHKHPLDMVGKLQGRGWYLPWYKRDPNNPKGKPIPVLIAEAETGEITKHGENPEIVMHRVHARLFQKGVHAANIEAATVRADQQAEKVVATGACRVVSLINPADTVLTADRITWYTANTRFVAEGHALVVRRPRDGGIPITQEGGTIVYDLEHNTVTVQ